MYSNPYCCTNTLQGFVLSVPPQLAAVWFGANEASTATAIGVLGNQVGFKDDMLPPGVFYISSRHLIMEVSLLPRAWRFLMIIKDLTLYEQLNLCI